MSRRNGSINRQEERKILHKNKNIKKEIKSAMKNRKFNWKATLSLMLAASLTLEAGSMGFVPFQKGVRVVEAAQASTTNPNDTVTATAIPNQKLLGILQQLTGKGQNMTFRDLAAYTGEIDLSNYPEIDSIDGIGYAISASKVNLEKLEKITAISPYEFNECEVQEIKLPNSIQTIGQYAFYKCRNLNTINIPTSTTTICSNAFASCSSLDGIVLPAGLKSIEQDGFMKCTSLTSIVIPEGTLALGDNVFNGCTKLKTVVLPSQLASIPNGFFQATASLEPFQVPTTITAIGKSAFQQSGIPTLDLSACTGLKLIDDSAFQAAGITSVAFPVNSIERLGDQAFSQSDITTTLLVDTKQPENKVNIPDSIGEMGEKVFSTCPKLKAVAIPAKVSILKKESFYECVNLKSVEMKSASVSLLGKIDTSAFEKCFALENTDFLMELKNLKVIGDSAFAGTYTEAEKSPMGLKRVSLPNCVEEIGKKAFFYCNGLGDLKLSENLLKIGENCFERNTHLRDFSIPKTLTKIGKEAFKTCGKEEFEEVYFEKMYLKDDATISDIPITGVQEQRVYIPKDMKYNIISTVYINPSELSAKQVDGYKREIYVEDKEATEVTAKYRFYKQNFYGIQNIDLTANEAIEIGEGAFAGCINLDAVKLPQNLKTISDRLFSDCAVTIKDAEKALIETRYKGLKTVQLPVKLEKIGTEAFLNCFMFNLENGVLGEYVTDIGDKSFQSCYNLTKVVFQGNVKTIGFKAFSECANVITRDDGEYMLEGKGLQTIVLKDAIGLETIGSGAFYKTAIYEASFMNCNKLVEVPSSLFQNSVYLEEVYFPDSIEKINDKVFTNCRRFGSLKMPASAKVDERICYRERPTDSIGILSLTLRPVPKDNSVVVGESTELPLYALNNNELVWIDKIIVDDNIILYDKDNPSNMRVSDYLDYELVTTTKGTKGIKVTGKKCTTVGKPVKLSIQTTVQFQAEEGVVTKSRPTVDYNIIITEVPCEKVTLEQEVYAIGIDNTKNGKVIKADFAPANHSDTVTWTVIEGTQNITLEVAEDKKSAIVRVNENASYGTSKIEIKAGNVTQYCYVNIVAPANEIAFQQSFVKVATCASLDLGVTIKYNSMYEQDAQTHPDLLVYTSSDESIAKVKTKADGTCVVEGVGRGNATITARTLASNRTAICEVSVYGDQVIVSLKDKEGNSVHNGDEIKFSIADFMGVSLKFTKDPDETSIPVKYKIEDPSIVSCDINWQENTISLYGQKVGETNVTVYPEYGDPTTTGVTFKVIIRDKYSLTINKNIKNQVYTGKAIKPEVSVVEQNKKLTLNKDYTVAYSNNKKVGIATVMVTGIGDYKGLTSKTTFNIKPMKVTGLKVKKKSKKAIVSFKKVTGSTQYQIVYSTKKKSGYKQLASTKKLKYTSAALKKGKTYYFKVRAYKEVNGQCYYGAYSSVKSVKIK